MTESAVASRSLTVLFLGMNTFPVGFAAVQKAKLICQSLNSSGCHAVVINRWWGIPRPAQFAHISAHGHYEGVEYIFASGSPFRPASFLKRKLLRVTALFREFAIIRRYRREGPTAAIVASLGIFDVLYFVALARLLSFPVTVTVVEVHSIITRNESLFTRVSAWLFDRLGPRIVDGTLPISEYLMGEVKRKAPGTPSCKLPVLVDLSRFTPAASRAAGRYLLYCGVSSYLEVIRFVLEAYRQSACAHDVSLYLIVSGPQAGRRQLAEELAGSTDRDRIKVFADVTDAELASLYLGAHALLIPLRPTIQDEARFPHKFGEYLASGRPVITTSVGEVKTYFKDRVNAFVTPHYDVAEFSEAIDATLRDPVLAETVGKNGRLLAEQEFSHVAFGPQLRAFLESLL